MKTRHILSALFVAAIAVGGCSSDTRKSIATDLQTGATDVGDAVSDVTDDAAEALARNIATQEAAGRLTPLSQSFLNQRGRPPFF